jgi:hypothetical protein
MGDLNRYADEEFDPDGLRPSDAATRAFLSDQCDLYQSGGKQKIEFTADEFIAWYENEVEVVRRAMLKRIYGSMFS